MRPQARIKDPEVLGSRIATIIQSLRRASELQFAVLSLALLFVFS